VLATYAPHRFISTGNRLHNAFFSVSACGRSTRRNVNQIQWGCSVYRVLIMNAWRRESIRLQPRIMHVDNVRVSKLVASITHVTRTRSSADADMPRDAVCACEIRIRGRSRSLEIVTMSIGWTQVLLELYTNFVSILYGLQQHICVTSQLFNTTLPFNARMRGDPLKIGLYVPCLLSVN